MRLRTTSRLLVMALAVVAATLSPVASARANVSQYGIGSTAVALSTVQAGAHPDLTLRLGLKTDPQSGVAYAGTRDVIIDLPPGLVAAPGRYPACPISDFVRSWGESEESPCPLESQVGVIKLNLYTGSSNGDLTEPLYNLSATEDVPARLGFFSLHLPVILEFRPRPGDEYAFTARIRGAPDLFVINKAEAVIWGVPSDPSHDHLRLTPYEAMNCGNPCEAPSGSSRESGLGPVPFMTNPTRCRPVQVRFAIASYTLPAEVFEESTPLPDLTGCEALEFSPTASVVPTTTGADSPSGLRVKIEAPTAGLEQGNVLAPAALRVVAFTLPEGFVLNPSALDGMKGCSEDQVGLLSRDPPMFDGSEAICPPASTIGDVRVSSPIYPKPLHGSLYLATPRRDLTSGLFSLYLVAEGSGLRVKLPGELELDPVSGRVAASVDGIPQLPIDEISIDFKGGPRGLLTTPSTCGSYRSRLELRAWAGQVANLGSTFGVTSGPSDQRCPAGTFAPEFAAGTSNSAAGAPTPLMLRLDRRPGEESLGGLEATLPKGVMADFSGVDKCPAATAPRGECPSASQVGTAAILAGAGPQPMQIPQPGAPPAPVYLAGPYAGAPFSLVASVPVAAGPFDLGRVVVRAALFIHPRTAQLTVRSEPLPQILEGVPIAYRQLRFEIDRSGLIRNPTSCDPSRVTAEVTSAGGKTAKPSSRFQVGNCARLRLRPRLAVSAGGALGRNGHPRLRLLLRGGTRQAGISRLAVLLPRTELLDNRHVTGVCPTPAFARGLCPAGSVYGHAKIWTPLLDRPLSGPVYLRSSRRRLPALVASLRGEIALDLVGHIDSVRGRLQISFAGVPDAPIEKLLVTLAGGRRGLLVNTTDLCREPSRVKVVAEGHNGRRRSFHPRVRAGCGGTPPEGSEGHPHTAAPAHLP